MKLISALAFLTVISHSAFAGQDWVCTGENKTHSPVKVVFETKSNTAIAQILIMKDELILSRINKQVRRDAGYKPTVYTKFNRFNVGARLNLILPQNLAHFDDEFNAYLQNATNAASPETVHLTCTGAG